MKDNEKQNISMKEMLTKISIEPITNCNCRQDKDGAFADLLNQEIEELQKAKAIEEMAQTICEFAHSTGKCDCVNSFAPNCTWKDMATSVYNAGYLKITDSVVLTREELKRLETNYKIGLGKSQSWCKSLKNRIEELEKENFKLKVDNEVLKEEKEQFENDVCNYEMNLQHLTQELENKSKETAEKIYEFAKALFEYDGQNDYFEEVKKSQKNSVLK